MTDVTDHFNINIVRARVRARMGDITKQSVTSVTPDARTLSQA
jgi:hypothetical protein